MIIISKQKDFYDYLTGIYGIDTKKVLDRRGWERSTDFLFPSPSISSFNSSYEKEYKCEIKVFSILGIKYHICYGINKKVWLRPDQTRKDKKWGKLFKNKQPTHLNKIERLPFLIHNYNRYDDVSPIIMKAYHLNKIFDADTIYKELDLFLGWMVDNPPIKNNQTDIEKVKSHGFNTKTSFRPKMK